MTNLLREEPQIGAPTGGEAPIDYTREAGPLTRFLGGFRLTPGGRASLAQSMTGNRVYSDASGDLFIHDPNTNTYVPYDKPDFTIRDIYDLSGLATEIGPTLLAGTAPTAVGAAAAGGAALRQGISEVLPGGGDDLSALERATRIGAAGALGAGSQAGANLAMRALDKARPSNIFANYMQAQLAQPTMRTGQRIAERAGIPLTPGQMTEGRALLTVEGFLRRHPASANIVQPFDDAQTKAAVRRLDSAMNVLDESPVGAARLGRNVTDTFDQTLDNLVSKRRVAATRDFGALERMAPGSYFEVPNAVAEIDNLIQQFSVPGGGDASAALVSRLRNVRDAWTTEAGFKPIRPQQMQRLLQIYSNASKGKGRVFQDLDTAQERMIAGRVARALERDLDDVASFAGAQDATAAQALQAARANYRTNSQAINALEDSTLGRMFRGETPDPETVARRLVNLPEGQINATMNILSRTRPEMAGQVKRYLMENVLERSGLPQGRRYAPGLTPEDVPWKTLSNNLRKSPIWAQLTRRERFEVGLTLRGIERMAKRNMMEGAPTEPLRQAGNMLSGMMGGAENLGLGAFARTAAYFATPRRLAEMLFDPQARKAVVTLTQTKPPMKKATQSALYLGGLMTGESLAEPPPPQEIVRPEIGQRAGRNLLR